MSIPSMNSLVSIFTLRGRCVLCCRSLAVTLGYSLSCFDMSVGKASILCCHGLPPPGSSPFRRSEYARRCSIEGCCRGGRACLCAHARRRQFRDGRVNSCWNMRVTAGESIGTLDALQGDNWVARQSSKTLLPPQSRPMPCKRKVHYSKRSCFDSDAEKFQVDSIRQITDDLP